MALLYADSPLSNYSNRLPPLIYIKITSALEGSFRMAGIVEGILQAIVEGDDDIAASQTKKAIDDGVDTLGIFRKASNTRHRAGREIMAGECVLYA